MNYKEVASDRLYAIGPTRKGCLWETTAVPEIRVQAAELGERLAEMLDSRRRPRELLKNAS
jgi:uncharacterized NAD(P)/FAD-binding protein YdhS